MGWMETNYSKHTHFKWKIKWRLGHLSALGIVDETVALTEVQHNFLTNSYHFHLLC